MPFSLYGRGVMSVCCQSINGIGMIIVHSIFERDGCEYFFFVVVVSLTIAFDLMAGFRFLYFIFNEKLVLWGLVGEWDG